MLQYFNKNVEAKKMGYFEHTHPFADVPFSTEGTMKYSYDIRIHAVSYRYTEITTTSPMIVNATEI